METSASEDLAQPGLFVENAMAGYSLEWTLSGNAGRALATLAALDPGGAVIGIGAPLVDAAGGQVPGLRAFNRLEGRAVMPATQRAVWAFITDDSPSAAFQRAETLTAALADDLTVADALPLFRYRDGRDLTGYRDGTANPKGGEARDAALIAEGDQAGGSFVLVQRYLHFRNRFARLAQADRDDVIGRRLSDDEEMEEAPDSSHVKRTDQEGFDQPAFMLRRSMPWGDPRRHGLQFIAFADDLERIDKVLRRMCGLEDGIADALLVHTQAETGSYYYCPPMRNGRLDLGRLTTAAPKPTEAAAKEPADGVNTITVRANGPYACHGAFHIGASRTFSRINLCRCGGSRTKPLCDGSHEDLGFRCSGEADPVDGPHLPLSAGAVEVDPIPDGPLVLTGPVEIISELGKTIAKTNAPALCRCGHSANKPFCDGSHARADFKG